MSASVTIVIPSYARTAMLAESLYSALNQDYDGTINVVVLNACPLQVLTCNAPSVRIVNAPLLCDSPLGLIRDDLVQAATGDVVCIWDDDDIYLPTHVASLVAKLRDGEPAARLRHMVEFNGVYFTKRGADVNAAHTAVFRRDSYGAWPIKFDRTADSNRADDEFWQRCIQGGWFRGRHHHETDGILTCVLRTDSERIRASRAERGVTTSAHVRDVWNARIANGEEPKGDVCVVPSWSRNWTVAVQEFIDGGMVSP